VGVQRPPTTALQTLTARAMHWSRAGMTGLHVLYYCNTTVHLARIQHGTR